MNALMGVACLPLLVLCCTAARSAEIIVSQFTGEAVLETVASITTPDGDKFDVGSGTKTEERAAVLLKADAPDGKGFFWWVISPESTFVPVSTAEGGALALFLPSTQGKYLVMLAVWTGESSQQTHAYVEVGDVPDPDPDPDPDPHPITELHVLVIEQEADRTAEQAQVLTSTSLRDMVAGRWHVVDKDMTDPSGNPPAQYAQYLDEAADMSLPIVFFIDQGGNRVYSGPMPETIPAMEELLKQYLPKPEGLPSLGRKAA